MAEETPEDLAATLSRCFDAESNLSAEQMEEEGIQSNPNPYSLYIDINYEIMAGVWDGKLSDLLVDEPLPPADAIEVLDDAALSALLAE